jgi:hypothetical protein
MSKMRPPQRATEEQKQARLQAQAQLEKVLDSAQPLQVNVNASVSKNPRNDK